jgi:uncharacterized protein
VLALSPLPLLVEFGIVVALSVLAALVSVLLVLPPLLLAADRHGALVGVRDSTVVPVPMPRRAEAA